MNQSPVSKVTLYSKPDCHLCDVVKAQLTSVRKRVEFDLLTVDITTQPELWRRYRTRIPVVLIEGEEAFVYRINEEELVRRLTADKASREAAIAKQMP